MANISFQKIIKGKIAGHQEGRNRIGAKTCISTIELP
jgi:hypothetical protein